MARAPRRCLAALLVLAVGAHPALAAAQDPPAPPAPAASPEGPSEPVVVWNRTIAELRAVYPPRTLAERARDVAQRIESVPAEDLEKGVVREAATIAGREGVMLSVSGRMLVFLSGEDVPAGTTLEAHAEAVAGRIGEVLGARRAQTRLPDLLRGAGLSLVTLLGACLLIWGAVRLRRRLDAALVAAAEGRRLPVAGIDALPILLRLARLLLSAAALVAEGVVVFLWLTFALSQFPYSEPLARRLGELLLGVLSRAGSAALGALPGLLFAAVIFGVARFCDRAQSGFFQGVIEGRITVPWNEPETARATRRLCTGVIWIFAFVLAYPYLPGADTAAFKGVSVLLGLMVSLGSAGIVNQLMSGFVIVYSRSLKPGDWVRVKETEGAVVAVGVLSTKIATPTLEEVTIPNAVLVGDRIVNYSRRADEGGPMLSTAVTIGYDAPWRTVHGLLLEAAAAVPLARKEPAPLVLQRALSDFYVEYELRVHHDRPADRARLQSELNAAIQDAFNGAGVQIMSPHFVAQPGEAVVVPKEKWGASGGRGAGA